MKADIHLVPLKSGRDLSVPTFTSLTLEVSVPALCGEVQD